MTQPNPNDQAAAAEKVAAAEKAAAEKAAAEKAAREKAAPKLLDVVKFTHHDVITGRDFEAIGVVVRSDKDDRTVAVRALEHHYHEVDPANASVLNPADFED
jgi:hypothetical protein